MAAPSVTWNRTYIMGNSGVSPLDTPITPVATTLIPSTSGTYGTTTNESTFDFAPTVTGTYGGRVVFTASRDFTTRTHVGFQLYHSGFPSNIPANLVDTVANGGMSILFFDSSGNYSEFNIFGDVYTNNQISTGGWQAFQALGTAGALQLTIERSRTPDSTSGTINWALIDGFEFFMRNTSTDAGVTLRLGNIFTHDVPVLTDGEVANAATFTNLSTAITAANSNFQQLSVFRLGGGLFSGSPGELYEPRYSYTIGDGSTFTYFRDSGSLIAEYPQIQDDAAPTSGLLLDGNCTLTINTSATCDVEMVGTSLASYNAVGGRGVVTVTGNTAASVVFTDVPFYYKEAVTLAHATSSGCIFDDCEAINIDTTTALTGGVVRNSASTSTGITITSGAGNYSSIQAEFKTSNTGEDLTMGSGGAGTYNLSGVTVEAGHTLKVRNNSATNAITVEIAAGITTSTSTAGGSITISAPATSYTLQLPSIIDNSRFQIYNVTTATELTNSTTSGGSGIDETYLAGTDYTAGDIGRYRVTYQSGVTAKQEIVGEFTFPATTTTNSLPISQDDDTVYNTNAIDGSLITKFSADYVNDEVDLSIGSNFTGAELYAWWVYNNTTSQGIAEFFGGIVAIDAANFNIKNALVDIFLDNTTTSNYRQTDTPRIFRDDSAYPVRNGGATSGGGGLDINWLNQVYLQQTGSGPLTPSQEAELTQAAEAQQVNTKIGTPATDIATELAVVDSNVDAVLADTNDLQTNQNNWLTATGFATPTDVSTSTSTIQADIAALDAVVDTKASQASVDSLPDTAQIADRMLGRSIAGGSDGGRMVRDSLRGQRNRVDVSESSITVYEEDDATVAWSGTVTTAKRDAISSVDPS